MDHLHKVRQKALVAASASHARDDAIRAAHAQGWSLRAIAAEAGLSFQRVHQIVTPEATPPSPSGGAT